MVDTSVHDVWPGVTGPASSTDETFVRWNGTSGRIAQGSGVTCDDSDNVALPNTAVLTVRDIAGDSAILYISCDKSGVDGSVYISNSDASQVCNMSIDGTITSAGYLVVTKELWNANSIIVANTNNTPEVLIVAEQRLVGRITSGNITDLTATQVRTLINVEDGSTADQTGAEIKSAYEGEADTNAYTDAEKSKLGAVEASADVTDATNVDAAGATMNSDVQSKGIYVADPEDDEDLPFFHTPVAITVTAIFGETDTGTVDLKMYWRPEGAAFAGGTAIEDTALVADDDEQRQTSGFEDATIPAGSYVVLVTSAVADSPTKLVAGIEYTVD